MRLVKQGDIVLQNFVQNVPAGIKESGSNILPRKVNGVNYNYNVFLDHKNACNIYVSDCQFNAGGYNCIEGNVSSDVAKTVKNVVIENCSFNGAFSNNAICFYNFADNATVTVKNCTFAEVSNPIRISNNQNAHITVKVEDCVIEKGESGDYRGLILFQDYTSGSPEAAALANHFASSKVNVHIKNVSYKDSDGNITKTSELTEGVNVNHNVESNEHQLIYVFCSNGGDGLVSDQSRYPTVTVK